MPVDAGVPRFVFGWLTLESLFTRRDLTMNEARSTFLVEENKFLRTWVRELIQERDSLRQDLFDVKDELMFPANSNRWVTTSMEYEDLPF